MWTLEDFGRRYEDIDQQSTTKTAKGKTVYFNI